VEGLPLLFIAFDLRGAVLGRFVSVHLRWLEARGLGFFSRVTFQVKSR
jgi:hypothetical protein